jgi:tricorn protease
MGDVISPSSAVWNPNGHWDLENYGIAPDVDVEIDPVAARSGRDLQLEKAVQVVMEELERNPPTPASTAPLSKLSPK